MYKKIDWDSVTITNNFLFQETLRNKTLCKYLLEHVLHIQIKTIRYMETEKTMSARLRSKNTRLDVYVEDNLGNVSDVEMQTTGSATTAFTKQLDKEAMRIRNNDDWRWKIMTLDMEIQDMKRRTAIREREKGKKEGIKEGLQKSKIEIAKAMLEDGMDISKVARLTKLSVKEVAALA